MRMRKIVDGKTDTFRPPHHLASATIKIHRRHIPPPSPTHGTANALTLSMIIVQMVCGCHRSLAQGEPSIGAGQHAAMHANALANRSNSARWGSVRLDHNALNSNGNSSPWVPLWTPRPPESSFFAGISVVIRVPLRPFYGP
jgi:hypothetical protein